MLNHYNISLLLLLLSNLLRLLSKSILSLWQIDPMLNKTRKIDDFVYKISWFYKQTERIYTDQ